MGNPDVETSYLEIEGAAGYEFDGADHENLTPKHIITGAARTTPWTAGCFADVNVRPLWGWVDYITCDASAANAEAAIMAEL